MNGIFNNTRTGHLVFRVVDTNHHRQALLELAFEKLRQDLNCSARYFLLNGADRTDFDATIVFAPLPTPNGHGKPTRRVDLQNRNVRESVEIIVAAAKDCIYRLA